MLEETDTNVCDEEFETSMVSLREAIQNLWEKKPISAAVLKKIAEDAEGDLNPTREQGADEPVERE